MLVEHLSVAELKINNHNNKPDELKCQLMFE